MSSLLDLEGRARPVVGLDAADELEGCWARREERVLLNDREDVEGPAAAALEVLGWVTV